MKIKNLKKKTVKELGVLSDSIEKLRNKINKRITKVNDAFLAASEVIEEVIDEVNLLELEKKNEKVKAIVTPVDFQGNRKVKKAKKA